MRLELIGQSHEEQLRQFKPLIAEIHRLESILALLSDSELFHKCREYRSIAQLQEALRQA